MIVNPKELRRLEKANYDMEVDCQCPHCLKNGTGDEISRKLNNLRGRSVDYYTTPASEEDEAANWESGDNGHSWVEDRKCVECGGMYSIITGD